MLIKRYWLCSGVIYKLPAVREASATFPSLMNKSINFLHNLVAALICKLKA